jgi:hypothetical protein
MKTIIAYLIVVTGLPMFIGNILASIINPPIFLILSPLIRLIFRIEKKTEMKLLTEMELSLIIKAEGEKWTTKGKINMKLGDRVIHVIYDLLSGFYIIIIAGLIFYFLGQSLSIYVLYILIIWLIIMYFIQPHSFRMFLGTVLGLMFGYLILVYYFSL